MAWRTGRESVVSVLNFSTSPSSPSGLQRTTSESCLCTKEGLENISAHDILLRDVMHSGFLYKKAQERRGDVLGEHVGRVLGFQDRSRRWQLRYVIIYQHYVLYFRDDKAKKPQGVFSLKAYNRVMRDEAVSEERRWSFKIIGLRSDARTWYFNAASEKEMKLWMAFFKVAMEQAIHGKARDKSLKILQDLKYSFAKISLGGETTLHDDLATSGSTSSSTSGSTDPMVYEDIEMPLYDDTASPTCPNRPLPSLPPEEFIEEYDEDYITPVDDSCSSPQLGRPLPPTPDVVDSQLTFSKGLQQALENRTRTQKGNSKRMTTRQHSIDESAEEDIPGLRRGPEGNSFRKAIIERPHPSVEHIIKPVVSVKPPDVAKPVPRPKPKIATKPPVTKPKPVSSPAPLLPESASIQSSDKVYTEGLLRRYQNDGMYLIRLGSEQGKVLMVWDSQNTRCKHYKIFQDQDSNFHLDHNPKFDNLYKLLDYYKNNYLPNSQLLLQKPFPG